MKNISLTEKLVLNFLLIGICVISALSLFSFYSTRDALMSRTFDQLTSLRLVKQNQVEIFFSDRVRDLTFLLNSEDTRNMLSALNKGTTGRDTATNGTSQQFSEFLKKYHTQGIYFNNICLIAKNHSGIKGSFGPGNTATISDDVRFADRIVSAIQPGELQPVLSDSASDAASHKLILFLAGRIGSVKNPEGWLFLEISVEAINRIMVTNNPKSGLGLTGETYLVGNDYLLRSSSRFIPNSIMTTVVRTHPAIRAFEGKEGDIITRDYRNIPVLSSFSRISVPGLDWVILAEIDQKEAMIPIYHMRNSLIFLSILTSILFFVFVYFTSRSITKPLLRLRDAAVKIGKGQYDVDLPEKTKDEIGALTQAFATMSSQIKEKTKELQSERIGRLRSVLDAEESERQRLSREIHDGIGQSLIALKLRLESLMYIDGPSIKENINILKDQFDGTVDEIRRISNNLMPSVLEAFGITIALRNLCDDTMEHTGINIRFETSGDLETINTKTTTYIFRIAQEAINNIIKHSGAKEVGMTLVRNHEIITFEIRDDGRGFDVNNVAFERGNGLHNMNERVALMEGAIEILSTPNKGTRILIRIPVI
jgi:signal transduction histidine kinase